MISSPKAVCPPPRSNWACNRCRKTKARCLPSSQPPSCESFPQHQERHVGRRRARTPSKETLLGNGIIGDPGQNSIAGLGFRSRHGTTPANVTHTSNTANDMSEHHRYIFDRLFRGSRDLASLQSLQDKYSATEIDPVVGDVASTTVPTLSDSDICSYLLRYQSIQSYFPFLPLPDGWSVTNMKTSHPFFLLGILASMTHHQLSLNAHIHEHFLHVLAGRVIIRAEKCLDLIRGMLAQLSRFPLHLDPRKGARRMFQILQLAASMIEDLGFKDLQEQSWLDDDSDGLRLDERRLLSLACSCISSIASVSFQRPNCVPLTKVFERGTPAVIFLSNRVQPSHTLMYLQASLLRVAEDANKFRRENHLDAATIYMNLECFRCEMKEIVDTIHGDMENRFGVALKLSTYYTTSQINALLFGKSGLPAWSSGLEFRDWVSTAMSCCLEGMREFLETFVSLPIPEYRDLSFVQWAQLVQVLKLIPTLCFDDHNIPGWDTTQIRKELRIGMILESLCYRMHELTSTPGTYQDSSVTPQIAAPSSLAPLRPDWFLMFKSVLQILKETYDKRCKEVERHERAQQRGFGCPVLNGSIQESEFWRAFQNSDIPGPNSTNIGLDTLSFDQQAGDWDLDSSEWSCIDPFNISQM